MGDRRTMKASVLREDLSIATVERPMPEPLADEVLIAVRAVGVCGSDVHYYRDGRIGDFIVSGDLILGHEAAGEIVSVGSAVSPERIGERVSIEPQRPCRLCGQCKLGRYNLCASMKFYATPPIDGAFCEYVTIAADFAHRIPDNVSMESGALLEPLSVAIAACRKARVTAGSTILIAGAGPIGLLLIQTARAFGAARVVVTDPVPNRRSRALAAGAAAAVDPAAEKLPSESFDVFIDASGAQPAIASGIAALRPAGRAVLVGMGAPIQEIPVAVIQGREIELTGLFRYVNTWPLAIELVSTGVINLDELVTGRFGLEQVQTALSADTVPGAVKSIVYPDTSFVAKDGTSIERLDFAETVS